MYILIKSTSNSSSIRRWLAVDDVCNEVKHRQDRKAKNMVSAEQMFEINAKAVVRDYNVDPRIGTL